MSDAPEMRDRIEALAAFGTPHREIARVLRIELEVLRRDFEEELATGRTKANSRVAEALYRTAIAGGREGVTAAIFWLKARAGWKETSVHELSAADGDLGRRELVVKFIEPGIALEHRPGPPGLMPAPSGTVSVRSGTRAKAAAISLNPQGVPLWSRPATRSAVQPCGSRPVIAIASYPRSGNHLVRFVVEYATGRSTRGGRDTEIDRPIRTNSFPDAADILAHVDPSIFVAQKAHKWKEALAYERSDGERFGGFLIVVRNPYEAVAGNVGRRLRESGPQPPDVEAYVRHQARTWRNLISLPIRNGRSTAYVWYEDLVSQRSDEWSTAIETILSRFQPDVQPERAERLRNEFPALREINRAGTGRSWGGSISVGASIRFHFDRLESRVGALVIDSIENEIRSLLTDCSELSLPEAADRINRYEASWRIPRLSISP